MNSFAHLSCRAPFVLAIQTLSLLLFATAAAGAQDSTECSYRSLGEAVASDTSKLRRVSFSGREGESTEGSSVDVYYRGSIPRVAVVTYFGETGKAVNRFFLRDSASFVLDHEDVYYLRPIGHGPTQVASRVRRIDYYCGGQRLTDSGEAFRGAAKVLADVLHRSAGQSRRK